MIELNTIHLGNNLDLLKQMANNSVDSIVTDPPYGISFMNKKWDYDVPTVELWQEVLRVLKPGGHALVACGTRTQHRMAVNLEDAGFEIRDIVAWVYGSGFPKSLDISKAIDKTAGYWRGKHGEIISENGSMTAPNYERTEKEEPVTPKAQQWQGWGTALKPAMELWTLCRKPLKGTVAENVLKYGTGGLNIDGCRVGDGREQQQQGISNSDTQVAGRDEAHRNIYPLELGRFPANIIHDGSDEVVKLFPNENSSGTFKQGSQRKAAPENLYQLGFAKTDFTQNAPDNYGDSGSASRFFYTAKASQGERNEGLWGFEEEYTASAEFRPNHMEKAIEGESGNPYGRWQPKRNIHPTVKPLELMRYLCRMITPKGGIVLDPFMGSGTTAIAAKQEKMNYIGMELEPKYVEIANARIKSAIVQYDIFDMMEPTL